MNRENSRLRRLLHNNKFLLAASILMAIVIWASIKINYNDTATRTITDVKVTLDASIAEESEYSAYYDEQDLYVDLVVSGRSFDINAYALSRDDVVVDAVVGYVDGTGVKTINLTPRVNIAGVEIVKITPATVTIFFDKEQTVEMDAEARLSNPAVAADGYVVEKPVPTPSKVTVTGPASVLQQTDKHLYFDVNLEAGRELNRTLELEAQVKFEPAGSNTRFLKFGVDKPIVNIPVKRVLDVVATVEFTHAPAAFDADRMKSSDQLKIEPENVTILTAPSADTPLTISIGEIDFSTLKNEKKVMEIKPSYGTFRDPDQSFTVTIDFSGYDLRKLDLSGANVTFVPADESFELIRNTLTSVTVIGPKTSLSKIDTEKIEIQVDASALDPAAVGRQTAPVTISLKPDVVLDDCWLYGTYTLPVRAAAAK